MKISNKLGLPQAIIKAMHNDSYDRGESDFTVTELLKPPRQRTLEIRHAADIEEDAEDMIYRLYGQIVHGILERANEMDLAEKRYYAEFLGHKLGGQIDTLTLNNGVLTDYKFTTAWGFKNDKEPKPDWVAQLNMQLEILKRNGFKFPAGHKLQIVGLLRDWQIRAAKEDPGYPQAPIAVLHIPIWNTDQTVKYIEERMGLHLSARAHSLPDCTHEERYGEAPKYAVMPKGGKRAVNGGLCDTEDGAKAVQALHKDSVIQYRPGYATKKCDSYCSVSPWCSQYAELKGKK